MSVSEHEVRHIAMLARLGLDDARVPSLVAELNGILEHMDVLQRVDTGDASLDPDSRRATPLRADAERPVPLARSRESMAPEMRDGFFLVPRLATHGDASTSGEGDDEG